MAQTYSQQDIAAFQALSPEMQDYKLGLLGLSRNDANSIIASQQPIANPFTQQPAAITAATNSAAQQGTQSSGAAVGAPNPSDIFKHDFKVDQGGTLTIDGKPLTPEENAQSSTPGTVPWAAAFMTNPKYAPLVPLVKDQLAKTGSISPQLAEQIAQSGYTGEGEAGFWKSFAKNAAITAGIVTGGGALLNGLGVAGDAASIAASGGADALAGGAGVDALGAAGANGVLQGAGTLGTDFGPTLAGQAGSTAGYSAAAQQAALQAAQAAGAAAGATSFTAAQTTAAQVAANAVAKGFTAAQALQAASKATSVLNAGGSAADATKAAEDYGKTLTTDKSITDLGNKDVKVDTSGKIITDAGATGATDLSSIVNKIATSGVSSLTAAEVAKLAGAGLTAAGVLNSLTGGAKPGDIVAAAQAQGQTNKDFQTATLQGSNPNINNPYGSQQITWTKDPVTGNMVPTVNQSYNPQQQAILDNQTAQKQASGLLTLGATNRANTALSAPLDLSKAPALGGDYNSARQNVINAYMSRANEDYNKATDNNQSNLIAAGIRPGTKAYGDQQQMTERARNDAYQQAEIAGGNTVAQANTTALQNHQAGVSDILAARNQPVNELTALNTTANAAPAPLTFPTFNPAVVAPPNIQQATVDANNMQQQQTNNTTNGLIGLGKTLLTTPP